MKSIKSSKGKTLTMCFSCGDTSDLITRQGLVICKYCKSEEEIECYCPICNEKLENQNTEDETFFHCWICSEIFTLAEIKQLRR